MNSLNQERTRLEALTSLHVLDTPRNPALDELVTLVAEICQVPIAAVSLVDDKRQWFKSSLGLNVCETSRDIAFCAYAIQGREVLVVKDALEDKRFAQNPLV